MKNTLLTLFFIMPVVMFLSSCNPMKKNVMEDLADDVKEVVISETNGESFLIAKEQIFQATSKSDNNGIRQITGYDEYRISSYDMNTGKLSKRISLGDRKEHECTFLGETDGKLWYKSVDKSLGFHARNPKTLEVSVTQELITNVNPFLKDNLSQPESNNIRNYYGFDVNKMMPMVSDNSGFVYYIDPVSLKAEKTSESIKQFKYDDNCLSSSLKFDAEKTIYLTGSPRNYFDLFNKEIKEPSFLKGEFIKSSNILSPSETNASFLAPYNLEIETYKKQIDSINHYIDSADTGSEANDKRSYGNNNVKYAKRNIENLLTKIKYAEDNIKRYSDEENYEIISSDNGVFILSQTDVTDKARVLISKIVINKDSTLTQAWQTELNDIYRDPVKGMDRSSFEVVFSKGDPNLRTMRILSSKGKLVILSMLKIVCLDMGSGKILWDIDLK